MSDSYRVKGALYDCFAHYFLFEEDLEMLIKEGYVEITSLESCRWLKSKTCLAEYIKWAYSGVYIPGGFWAPAENAFGMKRHSLRKLAGNNGNIFKHDESKDFKELKPLLQQIRDQDEKRRLEKRIFNYIKNLFLFAENEKPETVREILEKIYRLFNKD